MLWAVPLSDQGLQKIPLKLRNGQMNAQIIALDLLDDDTDSLQRDTTDSGTANKITHNCLLFETVQQRWRPSGRVRSFGPSNLTIASVVFMHHS